MDHLEAARRLAIGILANLPKGTELHVEAVGTEEVGNLLIGLGLCIGKGHAVYRGDHHYRITPEGLTYFMNSNDEE